MQTITHNAALNLNAHAISTQVANFASALQNAFNASSIKAKATYKNTACNATMCFNATVYVIATQATHMQAALQCVLQLAKAHNVQLHAVTTRKTVTQIVLHNMQQYNNVKLLQTKCKNAQKITQQQALQIVNAALRKYAHVYTLQQHNSYATKRVATQVFSTVARKTVTIYLQNNMQQKALQALQQALQTHNISATVKQHNCALQITMHNIAL